jgi:hypothetical protein
MMVCPQIRLRPSWCCDFPYIEKVSYTSLKVSHNSTGGTVFHSDLCPQRILVRIVLSMLPLDDIPQQSAVCLDRLVGLQ